MRLLALLPFLAFASYSQSMAVREITFDSVLVANQPTPRFRGGYVFLHDPVHRNVVTAYGPDGRRDCVASIQLPGAKMAVVRDIAVDSDGTLVVAATTGAVRGDPFMGGIVLLNSADRQEKLIDTALFMPFRVAVAADHSIWILGAQLDSSPRHAPSRDDYMVARRYDRDGHELGAYVPRSSFAATAVTEPGMADDAIIEAARDRIGLVVASGTGREVIELDLDGEPVGRMRFDDRLLCHFAFTQDAHAFAKCESPSSLLQLLDPLKGTATSVPSPKLFLMGADKDDLAYTDLVEGPLRIWWYSEPHPLLLR